MTCYIRVCAIRTIGKRLRNKPTISSEMMLHKDYDRKGSVKNISGCESQGAWGQGELNGGKPPVVK
jgi:hypothetical protein